MASSRFSLFVFSILGVKIQEEAVAEMRAARVRLSNIQSSVPGRLIEA